MRYDFECYENEGGCGTIFEVQCSMNEIIDLWPKCPNCNKKYAVHRNYGGQVISVPKTLGMLAEKNSRNMSSDQKIALTEQFSNYKNKPFEGKLPEGAKTYERDSKGKRIPHN